MTTQSKISLTELAEKGADVDLLREMIQFVAQRMMDRDTEGVCAAAYGERSPERSNNRNGYREGLPFPRVSGAAAHWHEGPGGRDPGGLQPGRVDPLGG